MGQRFFGSKDGLQVIDHGRQVVSGLLTEIVFGPIDSRRYGKSLGVNPFPVGEKVCSFNCPYCECGWTSQKRLWVGVHPELPWPPVDEIREDVRERLIGMRDRGETLNAITFAGNGEPTLHPEFPALIEATLLLRDEYAPTARINVLTNATELGRPEIREALLRVDEPAMKLDAVSKETFHAINKPHESVDPEHLIELIADFPSPIIQSMFCHGPADNTGEEDVAAWIAALKRIQPRRVDLYSLDRPTPDKRLSRLTREELESLAERVRTEVGVPATAY